MDVYSRIENETRYDYITNDTYAPAKLSLHFVRLAQQSQKKSAVQRLNSLPSETPDIACKQPQPESRDDMVCIIAGT